jgi:hypothetical protein
LVWTSQAEGEAEASRSFLTATQEQGKAVFERLDDERSEHLRERSAIQESSSKREDDLRKRLEKVIAAPMILVLLPIKFFLFHTHACMCS